MPEKKRRHNRAVNILAMEKRLKALELRKKGWSYPQIGKDMGVSTTRAFQYVAEATDALLRKTNEKASTVLRLELERLDSLYRGAIEKAEAGDPRAAEICLKVMARRADLLGLDAPKKTETTMRVGQMSDAELEAKCREVGIQFPQITEVKRVEATSIEYHSDSSLRPSGGEGGPGSQQGLSQLARDTGDEDLPRGAGEGLLG